MFKKNPKLYLLVLFIPLLVTGMMIGVSYIYLYKSDEFRNVDYIVDKQIKVRGLYGSALKNMGYYYKYGLYKEMKPNVVALGSSRVLQFQKEAFNTSFLSLGGMSGGPVEAEMSLKKLLEVHKPKIILVGIDFWWLNETWQEPHVIQGGRLLEKKVDLSFSYLLEPYYWLLAGKVTPANFLKRLFSAKHPENTGVAAIEWEDGYNVYGTYFYTSRVRHGKGDPHIKFQEALSHVRNGQKVFLPADHIGPKRRAEVDAMLEALRNSGTEVILLLPPIAPTAYHLMMQQDFLGYLDEIDDLFKNSGFEYYNFLDPDILGTTDCEFYDTVHGGDILYRRMLLAVAQRTQTSLPDYLDLDEIVNAIRYNAGYASHPHHGEIDFLKIGCDK